MNTITKPGLAGLGSGHANYATLLMKDRELPAK